MDRVNSLKSAVRTRPREPLPSTLILLVTTVVSLEVVGGLSFRFVPGVSFCIVSGVFLLAGIDRLDTLSLTAIVKCEEM